MARSIAQLLRDALSTGLVNPFGPSDAAGTALLQSTQLYGVSRQARVAPSDRSARQRELDGALPAGPLATAVGIEARYESLQDVQMAIAARAAGGAPGPPKDASRQAQAAYVELVAPFTRRLEVQAAAAPGPLQRLRRRGQPEARAALSARADLADPGLCGKRVPRSVAARALHPSSDGIVEFADNSDPARCPTTGSFVGLQPDRCQRLGRQSGAAAADVDPGHVGLVSSQARTGLASVDFWAIHLKNVISQVDLEDVIANPLLYDGRNVFRGPVDPAFPQLPGPIIGSTAEPEPWRNVETAGFDIGAHWLAVGAQGAWGRVNAKVDATYITQWSEQSADPVPHSESGSAPTSTEKSCRAGATMLSSAGSKALGR